MNNKPRRGTIFGEGGEPISEPADSLDDLNLPPGVQALIETRVNAAIEQLREDNRREIADLVRKNTRKWQIVAAASFLLTLASWFIAPQQIKKWSKDFVQKRMTAPELKKAADEAIKNQMSEYVRVQIEPLKQDIAGKQDQLQRDQQSLQTQVRTQELATAAKAGDLAAYEELTSKAGQPGPTKPSATAALQEVEIYYDLDAAQLFTPTWVDGVSKQDPGWSVEELLFDLHRASDPSWRVGMINTIANISSDGDQKQKGVVEELFQQLESEKDLRVRARTVRAIARITKQEFRPLDKSAVEAWWKLHGSEPAYQSPYSGYFRGRKALMEERSVDEIIRAMDETIRLNPDALHCRCIKATMLTRSGQIDAAEKEFAEVEKRRNDFRWLLFWRSLLYQLQGKTKEAVKSFNTALKKSPELERFAESDSAFSAVLSLPGIELPSKALNKKP